MTRLAFFLVLLALIALPVAYAQNDDSPRALPEDVTLPLEEIAYQADFLLDPLWRPRDTDPELTWQPSRQGLSIVSTSAESSARYTNGTSYIGQNFYVELSFIPVQCLSEESALLLNTRADTTADSLNAAQAYVFVMQCNGTYRSRPVEEGGESGTIDFNGVLDSPLQPKQAYHLGVLIQGRQVIWYFDGALLGEYLITQSPRPGEIVPGAQLGMDVVITDLRIWELTTP